MRARDGKLAQKLDEELISFNCENHPLPGIHSNATRATLIEQMLESVRRVAYVSVIQKRDISERRADPNDVMFDPLKASILHHRQGRIDEAFWLVFLFVHFGKHPKAGWRYVREVYGRLGDASWWNWANTSSDPASFREWLNDHQEQLIREGVPRGFGNHRKRQSLDAYSRAGTGDAVDSYVRWIRPPRTHEEMMEEALVCANGDPRQAFDYLYQEMNSVISFGRLARFDYLTMVGKLGLAPIEPGSTYLAGATGPIQGARLLFGTQEGAAKLDQRLIELDARLNVGMQVIEDALCNWQKSPDKFKPFRV